MQDALITIAALKIEDERTCLSGIKHFNAYQMQIVFNSEKTLDNYQTRAVPSACTWTLVATWCNQVSFLCRHPAALGAITLLHLQGPQFLISLTFIYERLDEDLDIACHISDFHRAQRCSATWAFSIDFPSFLHLLWMRSYS